MLKAQNSSIAPQGVLKLFSYGLKTRASFPNGLGGIFLCATKARQALGPIHEIIKAVFPREEWLGTEVVHSPPSSAKVKSMWIYTYNQLCVFMAQCIIMYKNNFAHF
jgi:hypothetical protein